MKVVSGPANRTDGVSTVYLELTDAELLLRLGDFEDHFVERKSAGDSKDWLKTAVAFANSTPVGYPAVLFIGVRNDGSIEGTANLDSLQRTLSEKLADAYPPIYCLPKVLQSAGKQFLAVIIPGSESRPHFAGQAYVRDGSQTKQASEEQFARLIAQRNSKTYEILRWKGKQVTVKFPVQEYSIAGTTRRDFGPSWPAIVIDCNQFYVTLELYKSDSHHAPYSHSLEFLEISFDQNNQRLQLSFTRA